MHPVAERMANDYLSDADKVFGERVVGFYVVGSAAYDAFNPARSDLDFIAVLDDHMAGDCERLRRVQRRAWVRHAWRSASRGRPRAGAPNGCYLAVAELAKPVTEIASIGSHVSHRHLCGEAFDINPAQWKTFADRGIAVRGPQPSELGLQPEPQKLRQWTLDNLNTYWTWSCAKTAAGKSPNSRFSSARWTTAWNVLGTSRMHRTVATGDIISKEQAGIYALDTFEPRWHPIIREALAYQRGQKADPTFRDKAHRFKSAGEFGLYVIASANAIGG